MPILDPRTPGIDLFVIDEIGRMECFSERFVEAVRELLQSDRSILATVAQKGSGFIREVKGTPAARLLHLTRENRDDIARELAEMFHHVRAHA